MKFVIAHDDSGVVADLAAAEFPFIADIPTFSAVCVQVSLPESEVKAGLALQPQELEVSLVDRPLTDLLFTQFMASVSGKVHCLGKGLPIRTNADASGKTGSW